MASAQPMTPITHALLATAVAAMAIAVILRSPLARRGLDQPNERSMHTRAVPRTGGLGVLAGLSVSMLILANPLPISIWAALVLVVAISLLDDFRGLSPLTRLPLHLVAAALVTHFGLPEAGWTVLVLTTLAIAWMINLYNFRDGSDGLAGGQAVFGFGTLAIAAWLGQDLGLACACAAIAGAAAGFLIFNLPPARIFMGDAGSTSLGLLAGAIGVLGVARNLWSPIVPILAFFPFVFDASATLLDRLCRRQRVWKAHREHAYQRLNLGGWGHRKTALAYFAWMAVSGTLAIASLGAHPEPTFLLFMTMASAALYGIVRTRRPLQCNIRQK